MVIVIIIIIIIIIIITVFESHIILISSAVLIGETVNQINQIKSIILSAHAHELMLGSCYGRSHYRHAYACACAYDVVKPGFNDHYCIRSSL